jgi:hypothetical protein
LINEIKDLKGPQKWEKNPNKKLRQMAADGSR